MGSGEEVDFDGIGDGELDFEGAANAGIQGAPRTVQETAAFRMARGQQFSEKRHAVELHDGHDRGQHASRIKLSFPRKHDGSGRFGDELGVGSGDLLAMMHGGPYLSHDFPAIRISRTQHGDFDEGLHSLKPHDPHDLRQQMFLRAFNLPRLQLGSGLLDGFGAVLGVADNASTQGASDEVQSLRFALMVWGQQSLRLPRLVQLFWKHCLQLRAQQTVEKLFLTPRLH